MMSSVPAGGYNPDEPRDERGRWTAGGGSSPAGGSRSSSGVSWRAKPFDGGSMSDRAAALAGHMALHLPERVRHRLGWPDSAAASRLGGLLDRWSGAKRLDDAAFRQRYLGNMADAEASSHLRAAAEQAATAQTQGDLADAGKHLADAAQKIGVERWTDFLDRALERATALTQADRAAAAADGSEGIQAVAEKANSHPVSSDPLFALKPAIFGQSGDVTHPSGSEGDITLQYPHEGKFRVWLYVTNNSTSALEKFIYMTGPVSTALTGSVQISTGSKNASASVDFIRELAPGETESIPVRGLFQGPGAVSFHLSNGSSLYTGVMVRLVPDDRPE